MQGAGAELLHALAKAGSTPLDSLSRVLEAEGGDESRFLERVIELGLMSESAAYRIYAAVLDLPFVEPLGADIEPATLHKVPADVVRSYRALPVREDEYGLVVAMANPFDLLAIDAVQEVAHLPVEPAVCSPRELDLAIDYHLRAGGGVERLLAGLTLDQVDESAFANPQKLKEAAGDGAIVELVDHILDIAVRRKASDVHIEAGAARVRVRIRIDGQLEPHLLLPRPLHAAILSRVKILANLDISERRRPQDGRFELTTAAGKAAQFRVSTLPAVHGEKAVLRVLEKNNVRLDLDELGFRPHIVQQLSDAASFPTGMVLVTGPTGSGKTTTLYGVLQYLNREDRNLVTVEDPVEHELEGTTQVPVDVKADRTFASVLRSILRQDPDVIMVGEIRDRETAATALHAGLTGHMVLSTLHTNSALGTVTRLVDMGIEPYLLAPTLRAIVAQRLVRRLCPQCAEPARPEPALLQRFGLDASAPGEFRRPVGCVACRQRGYLGRTPIQELLAWNQPLARCLSNGGTEEELRDIAVAGGFETMFADGAHKAARGLTTLEEVLTATRA
ncbi:MAG: type II/IV secretion system protein [Planctomycetes bacterium]|nr:type II/IV secretion system protein [Planctomycetota bacterium]MCB9889091.1 type II/IV secretion system protein [Planctomycetota bacterium]